MNQTNSSFNNNINTVISVIGDTGKMGSAVVGQLQNLGYTTIGYNSKNPVSVDKLLLTKSQIVIDCSLPSTVLSHINIAIESQNKLIIATTGWYDNFATVQAQIQDANLSAIVGTNFDKIAILYRVLNSITSTVLGQDNNIRVGVLESHDSTKKDVSGTAVSIVNEDILPHLTVQNQIIFGSPNGEILGSDLQVVSERKHGKNPPTHIIDYTDQTNNTTLILTHKGDSNRQNYATGIVESVVILLDPTQIFVGIKDYANDIIKPQILNQIQI